MTYDVPLPPCCERKRQRDREAREARQRLVPTYRWGEDDRRLAARDLMWAIWTHDTETRERGWCEACDRMDAARIPFSSLPDIGTYVDEAGHRLVARGLWPRESVMTAREIAEETARAFLKGKR